jgi:hypothetical protein
VSSSAADSDFRSAARAHFSVFKEVAISSAALIYFTGFVYLYYYYIGFGVSFFALQLAPQHILTFAYSVLTHNLLVTIGFGALVLLLTSTYGRCLNALNYWQGDIDPHGLLTGVTRDVNQTSALHGWSRVLARPHTRTALRWALPVLGGTLILGTFPLSFYWAQHAARDDGKFVYQEAHEGSPVHLRVVDVHSGAMLGTTPEFREILREVNSAGAEGRAILIGESPDRLFVLVGKAPRSSDDPKRRLAGDRIFAIDKSDVAVEATL